MLVYMFRQIEPNYIGIVTGRSIEEIFWRVDSIGFDPGDCEFKPCKSVAFSIKLKGDANMRTDLQWDEDIDEPLESDLHDFTDEIDLSLDIDLEYRGNNGWKRIGREGYQKFWWEKVK